MDWIFDVFLWIFSTILMLIVMPPLMVVWIALNRVIYRWFEQILAWFGW